MKNGGYTLKNDVFDQESLYGDGMAISQEENHPKMGLNSAFTGILDGDIKQLDDICVWCLQIGDLQC